MGASIGSSVSYPSADQLVDDARLATGLADFGPPTFREGLDVLLASFAADTDFDQDAADRALAVVRRRLANRLRVEEWYRAHPVVESTPIVTPTSIMGLPRTGTTAVANIMSLDEQFRTLRMWEQAAPVPPPTLDGEPTDPRRTAMQAEVDERIRANPELAAMHLFDIDATTEDTEVLGLEFKAQEFTQPVTTYHDWWRHSDMTPTYAYHRRVVQLLGSQRPPNTWLFKAPHHKFHLDAIVAAYPDMRFVMTHRDPAKAVPSYANFTAALYPAGSRARTDPHRWGRHTANHLREGMEQAMAARDRLGEDRFHDIAHRDFVRDPFGVLERVYDFLGVELTGPTRDRMRSWHEENRSGAHGTHRYTAEEFGLDADELRADFAFYSERFGHLFA